MSVSTDAPMSSHTTVSGPLRSTVLGSSPTYVCHGRVSDMVVVTCVTLMPFTALVSVGTTRFDALIDAVLIQDVLQYLAKQADARLLIQYGASRAAIPQPSHSAAVFGTQCACSHTHGVTIYAFPYTTALGEMLAASDIVIAHAGAGTVLEALRAKAHPRVLIVPNNTLMDDHQRELAGALQNKYLCVGTTAYVIYLQHTCIGHTEHIECLLCAIPRTGARRACRCRAWRVEIENLYHVFCLLTSAWTTIAERIAAALRRPR